MIEQNVQVVRCCDQRIWVRLGSQAGCSACDEGKGCGAGLFVKLLQGKPAVIELARKDMDVKPGQMVLTCYGWPLLAALIGALGGYRLGTWLQLEALLLDLGTLLGGILAGAMLVYILKKRRSPGAVLNSLQMAVYYPSATPNICGSAVHDSQQD